MRILYSLVFLVFGLAFNASGQVRGDYEVQPGAFESKSIHIFPNPAGEKLNVSIDDLSGTAQLKVYNVTGKLMMQQQTNKAVSELNISKLQAGIYMMNIVDGNGVRNVKFVKE